MPAAFGFDPDAPGALEFRAQFAVLNVLEARQSVGDRAHISAPLDVVLAAQRVETTAVAAHVTGEEGEVDKGDDVVHGVVMFGDAERPTDLRALSPGVGMRCLPDDFGGHADLYAPCAQACTSRRNPGRPQNPLVAWC